MSTDYNVSTNGTLIADSGTFTVTGLNDTIEAGANVSVITVSPTSAVSNELIFLGTNASSVTDMTGTGDFIQGRGTEVVSVGQHDSVNLLAGQNDTVSGTGNDNLFLSGSGGDVVTLSGGDNNVFLGTGTSVVTINSGSFDFIDTNDTATHSVTITDNGNSPIVFAHDNTVAFGGTAAYTVYAEELGNHILSINGSGDDQIVVRNGTMAGHNDTITISGFVDGQDRLTLVGGEGLLTSGSDVLSHVADVNGSATLTLGSETVTFAGVTTATLHASDFHVV